MNQTLGFDVRMPVFSHETFGNSVELQSKKVLSRLSHTPWAATYLKSGALSGVAIEQCASAHIHSLTDLDRLLKAILGCYEEQDQLDANTTAAATDEDVAEPSRPISPGLTRVGPLNSRSDLGDVPARRDSILFGHRPSVATEPEPGPAPRGRRSLPWAVRDAFFCHHTHGRAPLTTAAASFYGGAGAGGGGGYRNTAESPFSDSMEKSDLMHHHHTYSGTCEPIHLYPSDDDVEVSPMSSARPSNASPRVTLTPRTSSAMANSGPSEQESSLAGGNRSTTSTAAPISPVEDAGRKTLPYVPARAADAPNGDQDNDEAEEEGLDSDEMDPGDVTRRASSACVSDTAANGNPLDAKDAAVVGAGSTDATSKITPLKPNVRVVQPPSKTAADGQSPDANSDQPPPRLSHTHAHSHGVNTTGWHSTTAAPGSPSFSTAGQAGNVSAPSFTPEELAGWFHLAAWTRTEIVLLLRELSGIQGYVAWSAWYWSYALNNPRLAMVHQALGSASFWKRLFLDGFSSRLANVHFVANQHMFQLKSAFQLLVSCIGALHGLLERMNTHLVEIQRQSEMRSSAVAAAAVASSTRPLTAAASCYSLEELGAAAAAGATGAAGGSMAGSPLLYRSMSRTTAPHSGRGASRDRAAVSEEEEAAAGRGVGGVGGGRVPVSPRTTLSAPTYTQYGFETPNATAGVGAGFEDVSLITDYTMLEELRVVVLSTISSALAVIRPQSLSSALEQSNAAFSENVTLERFNSDTAELASAGSGEDGPRARRSAPASAAASRTSAGASTQQPARPGSSSVYGFDRATSAAVAAGEDEPFYFASTAVPRRFGEFQVARTLGLREGVAALLYCVQSSQILLRQLLQLVVVENRPPATRHWVRVAMMLSVVCPVFYWLYTKSPAEVASVASKVGATLKTLFTSYVVMPFAQIRDAIFYVRPGVEDRRRTLDRDAEALANIIRDYHENYYPTMPQARLDEVRDHTFECFRDGVADAEGYGLIEKHYRDAVKHPIRSAFFGDLPRILLIQLSYQQLEVTRVVNGMDEVLEGNDLNFKIMAIMPVVGLVGLGALWTFLRWRAKYKPMQMRMKQYWRAVARVVTFAEGGTAASTFGPGTGVGYEIAPYSPTLFYESQLHAMGAQGPFDGPRGVHGLHPNNNNNNSSVSGWQPAVPSPRERFMTREAQHYAQRAQNVHDVDQSIDAWAAGEAYPSGSGHDHSSGGGGVPSARRPHAMPHLQPVSAVTQVAGRDPATEDPLGYVGTPSAGALQPSPVFTAGAKALSNYEQGTVLLLTHLMRSTAIWYLRRYPYYYELMGDLEDLESSHCTRHQRLHTLQRMVITHSFLK